MYSLTEKAGDRDRVRDRRRLGGADAVASGDVTAIAILLGLAIGVVVGAVGGGGAILALPVLIYVLDEPVGPASTASLVVVSVAAAIGAGSLARHGRVCWRLAFTFAVPAALGLAARDVREPQRRGERARAGVRAGDADRRGGDVDAHRATTPTAAARTRRWPASSSPACGVGAMTGFFGVGGGFVIVPVLTLWLGAPFRRAVATSLVIITLTGLAALASHLLTGARPDLRDHGRAGGARPASARCSGRWSASGCRSRCCGAGSP